MAINNRLDLIDYDFIYIFAFVKQIVVLMIITKSALMTTMVFLLTMKYSIIRKCDVNLHMSILYLCFI